MRILIIKKKKSYDHTLFHNYLICLVSINNVGIVPSKLDLLKDVHVGNSNKRENKQANDLCDFHLLKSFWGSSVHEARGTSFLILSFFLYVTSFSLFARKSSILTN